MKWNLLGLTFLFVASTALSSDYKVMYEGKNSKVVLTSSKLQSESNLNKYGKVACKNNQFCVLWFYSEKSQANKGVSAMKKGDMFAETAGLYGIYSKNKVVNNVICYEPKSGC
jgi:hypothetical protein